MDSLRDKFEAKYYNVKQQCENNGDNFNMFDLVFA